MRVCMRVLEKYDGSVGAISRECQRESENVGGTLIIFICSSTLHHTPPTL